MDSRAGLVCVLAALSLGVTPGSAGAVLPGGNGKIAVSVQIPNGDGATCVPVELPCADAIPRIAIFHPEDRSTELLATCQPTTCSETEPAWSPDGTRLAFARAAARTVWVANADGTNARYVTSGSNPAWSPDGDRLVVDDGAGRGSIPDLFIVDADGTNRRRLTKAGGLNPSWSRTGQIVFTSIGRRCKEVDLRTISATAGGSRRLICGARLADWSPTGRRVVYLSSDKDVVPGVWIADHRGKHRRRLARARNTSFGAPAFSPDGRKVLFTSHGHLYVIAANKRGARARRLTAGPVFDPAWQPLN